MTSTSEAHLRSGSSESLWLGCQASAMGVRNLGLAALALPLNLFPQQFINPFKYEYLYLKKGG